MNWKLILLGGLAYFGTTFVVSMITGFVIHEGILADAYDATESFWRPELNQEPPEMGALMPMWIFNGIVTALVIAAIYSFIRPAFSGAGWRKGLSYGLLLAAFTAAYHLGLSGFFNLPGEIWGWWSIDGLILFAAGGAVLGLVAEKVAPT